MVTLRRETIHLLDGAGVFDGPVDAGNLSRFVQDEGHMLVFATARGQVIGFASGTVILHPDKDPTLFINEVGVEDHWRRRGIATRLIADLREQAREKGCRAAWVATEGDNGPARALYASMRARETGGVVVFDWDNTPLD